MSKQCEIVGDLLPLYVDGVCSEASGDLVREHLDTCPGCRTLYEQMRARGGEEFIKREKDGVVRRHERKESRRILRYLFLSAALLYLPTLLLIVLNSEPDGTFIAIDRWFVLAVFFLFTVPFYLAFIEIGRLVCGAMEEKKENQGKDFRCHRRRLGRRNRGGGRYRYRPGSGRLDRPHPGSCGTFGLELACFGHCQQKKTPRRGHSQGQGLLGLSGRHGGNGGFVGHAPCIGGRLKGSPRSYGAYAG